MEYITAIIKSEVLRLFKEHDGSAEIVFRDEIGRYLKFQKISLADLEKEAQKEIAKLGSGFENFWTSLFDVNSSRTSKYDVLLSKLTKSMGTVSKIEGISFVNTALGAVNIAATVVSTVIICKKLDAISNKLDAMSSRLDKMAQDIETIKITQFETEISKPCDELVTRYKRLTELLRRGTAVSENDMLDLITACHSNLKTILKLRHQYCLDDMLELIYLLLPVMTNTMMLYYEFYYNPDKAPYVLHEDWMRVYKQLYSDVFLEEMRDYLMIDKQMSNGNVNKLMDFQRLIAQSAEEQINQTLSDLALCGDAETCRKAYEYAEELAERVKEAVKAGQAAAAAEA